MDPTYSDTERRPQQLTTHSVKYGVNIYFFLADLAYEGGG